MDFPTAVAMSEEAEKKYEGLMIAGFRRTSYERPVDSWAVDIIDPRTGGLITLDEKDNWDARLQELFALRFGNV